MRVFQVVLSIITLLMAAGMFGFNLWIAANFSKGLALPKSPVSMPLPRGSNVRSLLLGHLDDAIVREHSLLT